MDEATGLGMARALDVFLKGFSTTRGYTRPFPYRRAAGHPSIWIMADAPGQRGPGRVSELVVHGAQPPGEVARVRAEEGVGRHTLCVLLDDPADAPETTESFKRAGYRLRTHEPLFVLDIARRVRSDTFPTVRRVTTPEDAAAVARAARARQIPPEFLGVDDAECRLYVACDGEEPVGWVRGIRTHADCSWVSNLFVAESHRRRGIGRTLLGHLLDDDARLGITWSVLLASLTGAKLYPHVGYRECGVLLVLSPRTHDRHPSGKA